MKCSRQDWILDRVGYPCKSNEEFFMTPLHGLLNLSCFYLHVLRAISSEDHFQVGFAGCDEKHRFLQC